MALSLIDEQPIDRATFARRSLVNDMVRHRVATTALPHWLKSYWGLFVFEPGCALGIVASWIPAFHAMPSSPTNGPSIFFSALFAGLGVLGALGMRSTRRNGRFLSGTHAATWALIASDTTDLRNHVWGLNAAIRALEHLTDITPESRARIEEALERRRNYLMARHESISADFESTFGPCIAELEARGLYSRSKRIEEDHLRNVNALREVIRPNLAAEVGLDALAAPSDIALSALPDPLVTTEDLFDELERLHGHEFPR